MKYKYGRSRSSNRIIKIVQKTATIPRITRFLFLICSHRKCRICRMSSRGFRMQRRILLVSSQYNARNAIHLPLICRISKGKDISNRKRLEGFREATILIVSSRRKLHRSWTSNGNLQIKFHIFCIHSAKIPTKLLKIPKLNTVEQQIFSTISSSMKS